MARVPKAGALHRFYVAKGTVDPKTGLSDGPCVLWRDADAASHAEYLADANVVSTNQLNQGLTQEQALSQAAKRVEFVKARIVGCENWEDDAGPVDWPADAPAAPGREAFFKSLFGMPPGLVKLFIDTVMAAHFPASIDGYASAAREVVAPN